MNRKLGILALLSLAAIAFLFTPPVFAQDQVPADPSKAFFRILMLVDYMAGDYGEAVQNGKIVHPGEYQEMQEFSKSLAEETLHFSQGYPSPESAALLQIASAIGSEIQGKANPEVIQKLSKQFRIKLIEAYPSFSLVPPKRGSFFQARDLYTVNCATCHGPKGFGDGPSGKELDPPPRNFHENSVMIVSSPSKFYGIIPLGIEGTGMAAFDQFSQADLWNLSFYLSSLRFLPEPISPESAMRPFSKSERTRLSQISLKDLAQKSDADWLSWVKNEKELFRDKEPEAVLRVIRTVLPFDESQGQWAGAPTGPLQEVLAELHQIEAHFQSGRFMEGKSHLLDLYFSRVEPLEPRLRASKPALIQKIERHFLALRKVSNPTDLHQTRAIFQDLEKDLTEAYVLISAAPEHSDLTFWSRMMASFVIIFREGFEAFLIVGALISILKKTKAEKALRYIHAGWISGIAFGLIAFLIISHLISETRGPAAEYIEGFCALLASGVLFYVSYWLLSQSERTRWEQFIKNKTSAFLETGKVWLLFSMSFLAVFREAAETVLFYQALVLESKSMNGPILVGFFAGLFALGLLFWGILRLGVRVPLRKFFLYTSLAMMAIAVMLIGKAVHELIEAGLLGGTHLAFIPEIDFIGLYPLAETLAAQLGLIFLALLMGIWLKVFRWSKPIPGQKFSSQP